jgi:hypothetical protein
MGSSCRLRLVIVRMVAGESSFGDVEIRSMIYIVTIKRMRRTLLAAVEESDRPVAGCCFVKLWRTKRRFSKVLQRHPEVCGHLRLEP